MNVCRICLATNIYKDISKLQLNKKGDKQNFADVIKFCLNIQILKDSTITPYLCMKCYKHTVSFYNFKKLALKSNKYLQSLEQNQYQDKVSVVLKDTDVKDEINEGQGISNDVEVKEELDGEKLEVKEEHLTEDDCVDSDDEVLSVIKQNENSSEESKENAPSKPERNCKKTIKPGIKRKPNQVCEECGKSVHNLKEHSKRHKPNAERKLYHCKNCPKTFISHSSRYQHNQRKHLGVNFSCSICNKVISTIGYLRQHILLVHNPEKLPYPCMSCDKRYNSQRRLEVHMRVHTNDRPFDCDLCEKKFTTKVYLFNHKRQVHDHERTALCQYCSKSFFNKAQLQVHIRSHTKERPYKCEDCGKYYQTPAILREHQLIHSGIKNYVCNICNKKFRKRSGLSAHIISHSKVKKHSCQYCGVTFKRSDHRRRHEMTAHLNHIA